MQWAHKHVIEWSKIDPSIPEEGDDVELFPHLDPCYRKLQNSQSQSPFEMTNPYKVLLNCTLIIYK